MDYVTFLPEPLRWFPTENKLKLCNITRWALHPLALPVCLMLYDTTPPLLFLLSISRTQQAHSCLWASALLGLCSQLFLWLLAPSYLSLNLTLNVSFSKDFFPDHLISSSCLPLTLPPCPQPPRCFIFCRALTTIWNTLHFCLSHPTRIQVLCEQDLFCSLLISCI